MTHVLDLFSLEGRTALITGATRGIGQPLALSLAEAGADIVLIERDNANTTTKLAIEAVSRKATIYIADLSSVSVIGGVIKRVLVDGQDISILIKCGRIQLNLDTVLTLRRDVGAHMLTRNEAHRGSIIDIASLVSFQGGLNVPAYASAKGGVAQLTKALSNRWAASGIDVNAIDPGYIHTDMNEVLIKDGKLAASIVERILAGRWGVPDDFKGSVVYLASRASLYISGEILTVNGGWMGRCHKQKSYFGVRCRLEMNP